MTYSEKHYSIILTAECCYSLTIVQCFSGSDTKYCLNFATKNLMFYMNQGFDRQ